MLGLHVTFRRIGVLTRDELKALNRAQFVFLGLSQAA